ncbi:ASCH domain-containing protein [Desertimonas flava]|uniref:ASCH domain-containing protein n=1 Tax=Desertimonas flava TaxID=2064846 RepID=UPI000E34B0D8
MGAEPDRSHVLISLRPRFANLILAGEKTTEIRRGPSRLQAGATALVYSSLPVRALIGAVMIADVYVRAPSTVWRKWGSSTGLRRHEFERYVEGCEQVTAILLGAHTTFPQPVSLDELRRRAGTFVAPQSYRYVDSLELGVLLNGERTLVDGLRASERPTGGSPRPVLPVSRS